MAEAQSSLATGPLFTKEQIENARRAGIDDREIGLYLSEGSPEIQNALESGVSIDELADYFAVEPLAKKPEEPKQEAGPTPGQVGAGLAADIAIAEGMKAGGAAAGAGIGAIGGITAPAAAAIGYIGGALTGGVTGSIAAQNIEGKDDISWGRVAVDTALNFIPGNKLVRGPKLLQKVSAATAKRPIASTALIGAAATPGYMAVEELEGSKDYSLADYGVGAAKGAALGGGLGAASTQVGKLFGKYRNKTPEEIDRLVNQGDKSAIELVNTLTAGVTPGEIAANNQRLYTSITDYLKGTVASMAPSRVIGPEATRLAKYSKMGIEASESQALALGKRIDSYLAEKADPFAAQEAADLLAGNKLKTDLLPENIKKDIIEGRELIREQQQTMLDLHNSGKRLLPDGKAEMIEDSLNRGDYVTKFYRFFNEGGYKPSAEDAQKLKERLMTGLTDEQKQARLDDFISNYRPPTQEVEALRRTYGIAPGGEGKSNAAYQRDLKSISTPSKQRLEAFSKKLDEEKYTEAEANTYISNLNLKMKNQPDEVSSFVTGAGADPKFLKSRSVLSPELEKYLGRVDPVGEKITGTISFLSRDNELRKADAEISQTLADMGVLVKPDSPNWTPDLRPIKLRKGNAMLGDVELFGSPQTQAAINKIYGAKLDDTSQLLVKRAVRDLYDSYLSLKKGALVLGNIPSYLIQVPGNIAITLGAGMNPILGLGGAAKLALGSMRGTPAGNLPLLRNVADQASPSLLREFRNLQKRGMISNAVPFADVQASLSGKQISRTVAKALDPLGKAYSVPDNTFRLINYLNWKLELKRLMPTAPNELIEEGAIRATSRTYPNYDSLSEGVKAASRLGFGLGPFASYGLELTRSQYQQGKVIRELLDGSFTRKLGKEFENIPINDKAAKMLGAKRAAAMATAYIGAATALNQVNRDSVSEEEENALRETVLPDYAENKSLLIKKNDDGTFNYVNASYYAPQTMLMAPIQSAMRGETEQEALDKFAKTIAEDYGGIGTFAQEAAAKMTWGRDPKTGELISSEPGFFGQAAGRLGEAAMSLRPATVKALEKEQPKSEKLMRLAGIRVERQEVAKGFGFKARAAKEAVDEIKKNAAGAAYQLKDQRITPEEFAQNLQKENENYGTYMQRMQKHVSNLKVLGQDEATIIPMLKDAGFSNLEALDIMEGKFTPIDPNRKESTSEQYAKIKGKDDAETRKNIFELRKTDPLLAKKFVDIMKDEMRAATLNLTPKEKLLAALPLDDKVSRLMPEIDASQNPDAYVRRLLQRRIITPQDAQAIQIRRKMNE